MIHARAFGFEGEVGKTARITIKVAVDGGGTYETIERVVTLK